MCVHMYVCMSNVCVCVNVCVIMYVCVCVSVCVVASVSDSLNAAQFKASVLPPPPLPLHHHSLTL